MAFEKQLADTDSIYCTKVTNSNQSGIFISNLSDPELNVLFGIGYQSNDTVRLRLDKRNLAFSAVAHVIDERVWFKRKSNERWTIDLHWLMSILQTLNDAFSNNQEVFLASINKDDVSTQRLYMKGIKTLKRADNQKTISLKDFLFSGDIIVLTKLNNGDVAFEVKIPDNPYIQVESKRKNNLDINRCLQFISYGAPGTGKSHKLNDKAEGAFVSDNQERITFYPTYTFQQFVGAYKPNMSIVDNNGKREITYSYVPGPFLRQVVKAIQNPKQGYLLIIEELNRANAAAVFGDVFQLLDRKEDGVSEYPIGIGEDMKQFFMDEDALADNEMLKEATDDYTKLRLPANFYIWATMNSADQGVFPLDTAFKRRWEFEYLGIDTNEDKIAGYNFTFQDGDYDWNVIRKAINARLLDAKINEDKLIGPFFIKLETLEDDNAFMAAFKSKVLMYLFEDAIRHSPHQIFRDENGKLSYSIICSHLEKGGLSAVFNFDIDKHKADETVESQTGADAQ